MLKSDEDLKKDCISILRKMIADIDSGKIGRCLSIDFNYCAEPFHCDSGANTFMSTETIITLKFLPEIKSDQSCKEMFLDVSEEDYSVFKAYHEKQKAGISGN